MVLLHPEIFSCELVPVVTSIDLVPLRSLCHEMLAVVVPRGVAVRWKAWGRRERNSTGAVGRPESRAK